VARGEGKFQSTTFATGLITDASPLEFPPNSCLDIVNFDLRTNGSVARRQGIGIETNGVEILSDVPFSADLAAKMFHWKDAGGNSDSNFLGIRIGQYITLYREGDTVSTQPAGLEIDMLDYKLPTASDDDVTTGNIDTAFGRGYLFIVGKYIQTLIVEYDVCDNEFTISTVDILKRDFDGSEDNLQAAVRPAELSAEHRYNLINQGWGDRTNGVRNLDVFFNSQARYPSNADIWTAGRNSSNVFSPTELIKVNFGNSLAPRGRCISSIFDETYAFTGQSVLAITNIAVSTSRITVEAAHGLSAGYIVYISNNVGTCSLEIPATTAQVQQGTVTITNFSSALDLLGAAFVIQEPDGTGYYFWFDFGSTDEPEGRSEQLIPVSIDISDSSNDIATALAAAINGLDNYTASAVGDVVSVGHDLTGTTLWSVVIPDSDNPIFDLDITQEGTNDVEAQTLTRAISLTGFHKVKTVPTSTSFTIDMPFDCTGTATFAELGSADLAVVVKPDATDCASFFGPETTAFYAGRAWYSGIDGVLTADSVYFSQILTSKQKAGLCYQQSDPTSESISDVLDTDGGQLTITGLGKVIAMRELSSSLLLFTSTGVWELDGGNNKIFTATDYSVRKLLNVPCLSRNAIVTVESSIMFFAEDGIYKIEEDTSTLFSSALRAVSLSDDKIKNYYAAIQTACLKDAVGVYDYKKKQVMWFFNGNNDCAKVLNRVLVYNVLLEAFTTYKLGVDIKYTISVSDVSSSVPTIKMIYIDSFSRYSIVEFNKARDFSDLGESEEESYLISAFNTMLDPGTNKNARQVILHFLRTEEYFEVADDDSLQVVNPSACKTRVAWNWVTSVDSKKWGREFQGYRYRQLFIPTIPSGTWILFDGLWTDDNVWEDDAVWVDVPVQEDNFNTAQDVITTKTKLRGTGRSLSMQFRSEPGYNMILLGWSIPVTAENVE